MLLRTALLVLSLLLFAASLTQNSFCVSGSCDSWPGAGVLMFGALGLFSDTPANQTWLANPLLAFGWVLLLVRRKGPALVFCGAAAATAASFLMFDEVLVSERGTPSTITGIAPGYWLWLGGTVAATAAAVVSFRPDRSV